MSSDDYFPARSGSGDRGDKAGEHLDMQRGRYDAWAWVVIAFLLEATLLALPVWLMLDFAVTRLMIAAFQSGSFMPPRTIHWVPSIAGACFGLPIAWLVFHDRWKTIEAFSSRYCSGISRLSMLYVPFIALVYANVRGAKKLGGG